MAIIFLNFWKKRKFVIWKILLHETLIPEMWKQVLGVPEHGTRLDWFNGYLSGATHLSSPILRKSSW